MAGDFLYHERVSSLKTSALFLALAVLFVLLLVWRLNAGGLDFWAAVCLFFSLLFLFYVLNFRTLVIRLTQESLQLKFGIFTWTVPITNIEDCDLDHLPRFMEYGGAGIHFMMIRGRYRASFNFLEYPRVVIALRKKAGPVQDISFSTRRPEEVLQIIRATQSAGKVTR